MDERGRDRGRGSGTILSSDLDPHGWPEAGHPTPNQFAVCKDKFDALYSKQSSVRTWSLRVVFSIHWQSLPVPGVLLNFLSLSIRESECRYICSGVFERSDPSNPSQRTTPFLSVSANQLLHGSFSASSSSPGKVSTTSWTGSCPAFIIHFVWSQVLAGGGYWLWAAMLMVAFVFGCRESEGSLLFAMVNRAFFLCIIASTRRLTIWHRLQSSFAKPRGRLLEPSNDVSIWDLIL